MMMKKMKMPPAKKPASAPAAGPAVELELEAEPMDPEEEAAEGETADKSAPVTGGASLSEASDEELMAEMKKRGLAGGEGEAEAQS